MSPFSSLNLFPTLTLLLTLTLFSQQLGLLLPVEAADKDAWRSRAIYQLLTDRFAPPLGGSSPALTVGVTEDGHTPCADGVQTWCGGTWQSIINQLDYIQGMGMDAVWISPTGANLDIGTAYGFAYHGYWLQNATALNPRFGSASDLKALSDALHARNMYLMVDVVVNHVAMTPAGGIEQELKNNPGVLFQDPAMFHEQCWIDYSNETSVEQCWMGDNQLPLADLDTENSVVVQVLNNWIKEFVQEFSVDGLRIDAAKHIRGDFWPGFCGSAGVFCIGEVYGPDVDFAASYQTSNNMDSVLNFPAYYGVSSAFFQTSDAALNMTALVNVAQEIQSAFPDQGVLGNFLSNHDLPRYHGIQVDPRTAWNALVWQFMSPGIPTVYYGDEQEIGKNHPGQGDPFNRGALWVDGANNYAKTTGTYVNIKRLNDIRKYLIASNVQGPNGTTFLDSGIEVMSYTGQDFAFRRGPILVFLTNRGSPSQPASLAVQNTGWEGSAINMLECSSFAIGASQTLSVSYSQPGAGGKPYVFMSYADAAATGLCPDLVTTNVGVHSNSSSRTTTQNSGAATLQLSGSDSGYGGIAGMMGAMAMIGGLGLL